MIKNGELMAKTTGVVLGIEQKKKKDGTPFRLVRFSDEAGLAHEAVDHSGVELSLYKPVIFTIKVKWGEYQSKAYVNLSLEDVNEASA